MELHDQAKTPDDVAVIVEWILTVTGMHGAIYYPPIGAMAALLAGCDAWIGKRTTAGAAFLVVEGRKPA